MFQQSSHSEIMTIIYLINHSTNKLFNEVCIYIKIDPPQANLQSSIFNRKYSIIYITPIPSNCAMRSFEYPR